MKRILYLISLLTIAVCFAACGAPAGNSPANNANTGNTNAGPKTTAAAPTKDAIEALEKKAFEAWKNKDGKYFDGFLSDNFVTVGDGKRLDKAAAVKEIADDKCVVNSYSFSDEQFAPAGADAAIITLKSTFDATCDGKKMPSPVWSASVYVRSGDDWKAAYHAEVPVFDPNAKPAPAKPAAPAKKETADTKAPEAKPAETKAADPSTDAMLAAEKKGWDAWKAQDPKALADFMGKDFTLIDSAGNRFDGAGAVKSWTDPKCDVKSYDLTDVQGVSLGKDAGMITFKSTADGKCGTQPTNPLWGTSVYVKDGDTWKAALMVEQPE